jgi:hypothetical protein
MLCGEITLVDKNKVSQGKLRVIFLDLTLLNPNMATKLLHHAPVLRDKVLNSKTTFFIKKKNLFLFLTAGALFAYH